MELSNFDYHINYTNPDTEEFKRVKGLIEAEVQSNPDLRDSSVTGEKSLKPGFLLNRVLQKCLMYTDYKYKEDY